MSQVNSLKFQCQVFYPVTLCLALTLYSSLVLLCPLSKASGRHTLTQEEALVLEPEGKLWRSNMTKDARDGSLLIAGFPRVGPGLASHHTSVQAPVVHS